MNKTERAIVIKKILDKVYPETPIPLDHQDNFTLLIAVLLSAQCTDERVNQVTPNLFSIASDPLSMSKLSVNKIYKIIKPCGLGPQKSKAISKLSKILVNKFNCEVPNNFSDLESLPRDKSFFFNRCSWAKTFRIYWLWGCTPYLQLPQRA